MITLSRDHRIRKITALLRLPRSTASNPMTRTTTILQPSTDPTRIIKTTLLIPTTDALRIPATMTEDPQRRLEISTTTPQHRSLPPVDRAPTNLPPPRSFFSACPLT